MGKLPINFERMRQEAQTTRFLSNSWVVVLMAFCLLAMGASGYLAWIAITSSKVAGCGGGRLFNCGHVISSRWSLWMGIPVSLLAFGSYVCMGVGLLVGSWPQLAPSLRYLGWVIVTLCAFTAGLAAFWFISLQLFIIGRLCSYCLVAHGCGLTLAGIVFRKKAVGTKSMKLISTFSAIGIGLLIGGQIIAKPPATYHIETFETPAAEPELFEFTVPSGTGDQENGQGADSVPISTDATEPGTPSLGRHNLIELAVPLANLQGLGLLLTTQLAEAGSLPNENHSTGNIEEKQEVPMAASPSQPAGKRRFVSISGGSVKLDVAQWPVVGSQDATYIFVEMFDYSCPHCRKTHVAIKGAAKKLDGDVAVVALPIPLNAACNSTIQVTNSQFIESCELAKLAVSVWRVDAKKFTDFHNWMFRDDQAPTFERAYAHAGKLLGAEKVAAEFGSSVPGQYLAKNVELYKRVGAGNVPKLLFAQTSVVGEFSSIDALVDLIRREAQ